MKTSAWWLLVLIVVAAGVPMDSRGSQASKTGRTRVKITVTPKGFQPAAVSVPAGQAVTLVVTRKTERTCAKELVMSEYGIRQALPLNQPVEITFTPRKRGELRYACGMDMIAGKVVVE